MAMADNYRRGNLPAIWQRALAAGALALMISVSHAGPPESRPEALSALQSADFELRRDAIVWLGQRGGMEDLAILAESLRDEHPEVRDYAEGALVQVWSRSGDPQLDALLKSGIQQMEAGLLGQAVDTFSRMVDRDPSFAEGWNKRATAYFLLGNYELSLHDCDEVMRRNPLHFGALSGYGMIYLKLGKLEQALEYFERALDVNPNLSGAQMSVQMLRQQLGRQGKQST